eukprot:5954709-Prymnesium_polylepis.1
MWNLAKLSGPDSLCVRHLSCLDTSGRTEQRAPNEPPKESFVDACKSWYRETKQLISVMSAGGGPIQIGGSHRSSYAATHEPEQKLAPGPRLEPPPEPATGAYGSRTCSRLPEAGQSTHAAVVPPESPPVAAAAPTVAPPEATAEEAAEPDVVR